MFKTLAYTIYIRESCCSILACTIKKRSYREFEVKVDVQRGLRFREKFDNKRASYNALASMTCVIGLDKYESNPMDVKVFNHFLSLEIESGLYM